MANKDAWEVYDWVHGAGKTILGDNLGNLVGQGTSALMTEAAGERPNMENQFDKYTGLNTNVGTYDPTLDDTIAGEISAAPGVGNNNPNGVGLGSNEIANVNGKPLSTMSPSSTDGNNWSPGVSNIANPYISHDENTQDYS